MSSEFGSDFIWGVSSSAYQIEGASKEHGKGDSIWDNFCRQPGKIAGGARGDSAAAHYARHKEDMALVRELGVSSYSFSISWTRVQPRGFGAFNQQGLDFYKRLTDEALENGLDPWPCLYHWDLPQGLEYRGGWANRDTAFRFQDYAVMVAKELGDRARRWIVLREAAEFCSQGYLTGMHAPGLSEPSLFLAAIYHANLAQALGSQALRGLLKQPSLGAVARMTPFEPARDLEEDIVSAARCDLFLNQAFWAPPSLGDFPADISKAYAKLQSFESDIRLFPGSLDWLGMSYSAPCIVSYDKSVPFLQARRDVIADARKSASGLKASLMLAKRDYPTLPIAFVSAGIPIPEGIDPEAALADTERVVFLREHLAACAEANSSGTVCGGFFADAFLDGFEWHRGFSERRGLVHVDFENARRTVKESFKWLRKAIDRRKVD